MKCSENKLIPQAIVAGNYPPFFLVCILFSFNKNFFIICIIDVLYTSFVGNTVRVYYVVISVIIYGFIVCLHLNSCIYVRCFSSPEKCFNFYQKPNPNFLFKHTFSMYSQGSTVLQPPQTFNITSCSIHSSLPARGLVNNIANTYFFREFQCTYSQVLTISTSA